MRTPRPTLYGPTGRKLAYWEFYEGAKRTRYGDSKTFDYRGDQDTFNLLPSCDWRQVLRTGRFLFANVPILRGAILEQASLSFPLEAQYTGADKTWGNKAEEWLYNWRENSNIKGPAYDAEVSARVRLVGRKVDGDIATALTMSETGWPKVQYVRAHRIGSRDDDNSTLQSGPYKGNLIRNGVVTNRWGTPIAFLVLGDDSEQDRFYRAGSEMFLTFRPDLADQDRGISELAACIENFEDLKRLREYEMRAQQIGAAIALLEKNETGMADEASMAITRPTDGVEADTASGLVTETFEAGLVKYYKAASGSGLEAFRADRPSADAQRFEDKIVSGAFYGIEWDPNFALAIKEPGGAWARTIIEKVRRCILHNQRIEARARKTEDIYALALAIKYKALPPPSDYDIFSWEYKAPARITADTGNEENAKREAYKLGLLTLRDLEAERGEWWEEIRQQKLTEAIDLLTKAKGLQAQFPELTLQECLALLEQRSPNPPVSAPAPEKVDNSTNEDFDE